jgi:hypothetical protein
MPVNLAMAVMSGAEFLLWAVLGYLFWTKKLQRRFPAMNAYLLLRVGSMPGLLLLLFGQSRHWLNDYCFIGYFFAYWAVYIASATSLFFVAMEVFRSALTAFPGLMKFGLVVFRWAAVVSVIVSLASVSYAHKGILIIPDLALGLMRSVSVLELCLLAFLCLSMNALRLSVRDRAFGIALGFGVLSTNDFVIGSLLSKNSSLTNPLQFVGEALILVTLGVWAAYFGLPEPARMPMVVPANSTIYRWNEIASALGHTGTQIAVQQPANSFFLTDVEKVVEKVLTRNLRESQSKS